MTPQCPLHVTVIRLKLCRGWRTSLGGTVTAAAAVRENNGGDNGITSQTEEL